jgi:hypothetical protein
MQNKKKLFRNLFNNEIGLLVNKVKPGGNGTSNEGNTARKFSKIY